jgi:hypothetical protein
MDEALLHDTVERLERRKQAATYGAVAGVVGGSHRTVMAHEPRNHRNSWVVNKRTRRPTGYRPDEIHPELLAAIQASGVIETPEDLDEWLAEQA